MFHQLLTISNQFYKLANSRNLFGDSLDVLKNKILFEQSWNNITTQSTGILFSQELQRLGVSREERKKLVDLSVAIHDRLADFSDQARKVLQARYPQILLLPPDDLIAALKSFIPVVRKYKEQIEHPEVSKFLAAVKDCADLQVEIVRKQEVDLEKYARLIYISESEFFEAIKNKLEKGIDLAKKSSEQDKILAVYCAHQIFKFGIDYKNDELEQPLENILSESSSEEDFISKFKSFIDIFSAKKSSHKNRIIKSFELWKKNRSHYLSNVFFMRGFISDLKFYLKSFISTKKIKFDKTISNEMSTIFFVNENKIVSGLTPWRT